MVKFSNYRLILNPMPQTLNTSLHAATVQDEDTATVVKLDIKAENAKSQP